MIYHGVKRGYQHAMVAMVLPVHHVCMSFSCLTEDARYSTSNNGCWLGTGLGVKAAIHLPPSIFNWHIIKEVMYSLEVCYHFLWIVWIVESVELLRGSWMPEVKGHRWNEQIPFLLCSIYGCTTRVRPFDYLIHDAPCYTPIVELCSAILCNELQSVCQFGSPDNITSLVEIQLD